MHRQTTSPRRLAAAAVITCAAALIPAAALADGGASPSAAPDTAPGTGGALAPSAARGSKCATSGLVVWIDTQGKGTAGSVFYTLEFTNLSGHPCTLSGYPGVSAVDLAGHQLGSAASREKSTTPQPVTLAGGATATAVLRLVDTANFPSLACPKGTAAGLRVFPPNITTSKVVPFPLSACAHSGPVYLTVRAVAHT